MNVFQLNRNGKSSSYHQPVKSPMVVSNITYTAEQIAIINTPIKGVTVVKAYAGTGKTSTLVGVARNNPNLNGLYIAFNKAIQEEASKKFPSNIECKTIHSIAYRHVGYKYQRKLVGNVQLKDIISYLDLYPSEYEEAQAIWKVLLAYLASDAKDFPSEKNLLSATGEKITCGKRKPGQIVFFAAKLWGMMIDQENLFPMIHDGYLKLFQLQNIKLNYSYIMFDEAQDSNPVTTAIVQNQNCPLIVVGDQYQNIYSFRGAFNALDKFQPDTTLYLTNSFRFGPIIADIANEFLETFFGENKPLLGRGFKTNLGCVDRSTQHVTLCRTNFEVFNQCVLAIHTNRSFGLIGGVQSYNFDVVKEAYYFSLGHRAKSPELNQFDSFNEMVNFVKITEDRTLKRLVKLVETYGHSIPKLIDDIKENAKPNYRDATCIITTAHKSKGLELDQVVIADDFPNLIVTNTINSKSEQCIAKVGVDISAEEVNLIYVAITRAIKKIELSESINEFLFFREKNLKPSPNMAIL